MKVSHSSVFRFQEPEKMKGRTIPTQLRLFLGFTSWTAYQLRKFPSFVFPISELRRAGEEKNYTEKLLFWLNKQDCGVEAQVALRQQLGAQHLQTIIYWQDRF